MDKILEPFFQVVQEKNPGISKKDIKIFDDGWDFIVFVVNNQEVFRFPRRDYNASKLENETKFLNKFSLLTTVSLPKMMLNHTNKGTPFVQYPMISGVRGENNVIANFSSSEKNQLAIQLGGFLRSLHSYPLDKTHVFAIEEINLFNDWNENFQKAQEMVFPLLTSTEQNWINKLFIGYFKLIEEKPVKKKLIHGDIRARHIIIDPATHTLSGIIDFGDLAIGDAAFDFAFLGMLGEPFLREVYQSYTLIRDETFETRRNFYTHQSPVAELQHSIALNRFEEKEKYKTELKHYIDTHPLS